MRKPDPERIYQARRAAVESNLKARGLDADAAEQWLRQWEQEAAREGLDRYSEWWWQDGGRWIAEQRKAGRTPARR